MGKVAVVGHVEYVQFLEVERVPLAGEITHARRSFHVAAGGGAVSAVQLLKLHGECHFFTAVGGDETGERTLRELEALGLTVHAARRPDPQRLGVCFVDDRGERTITVCGPRLSPSASDELPWDLLDECDSVYYTAGDDSALEQARRGKVLVSMSRVLPDLLRTRVRLDALVGSRADRGETFDPHTLDPKPNLMVLTSGGEGGLFWTAGGPSGGYPPVPLPGPIKDAYGCGDSFAAGLTYGLGQDWPLDRVFRLAATCGATCLTGRGPYERQHSLP